MNPPLTISCLFNCYPLRKPSPTYLSFTLDPLRSINSSRRYHLFESSYSNSLLATHIYINSTSITTLTRRHFTTAQQLRYCVCLRLRLILGHCLCFIWIDAWISDLITRHSGYGLHTIVLIRLVHFSTVTTDPSKLDFILNNASWLSDRQHTSESSLPVFKN